MVIKKEIFLLVKSTFLHVKWFNNLFNLGTFK